MNLHDTINLTLVEADLDHWSCVDPNGNTLWRRIDGQRVNTTFASGTWIEALELFDETHPLGGPAPSDQEALELTKLASRFACLEFQLRMARWSQTSQQQGAAA